MAPAAVAPVAAQPEADPLAIGRDDLAAVFPGADGVGPTTGRPPAAPVYRDGRLAGYVVSTERAVGSVGYSGKPLDVLVGVDVDGRITGARLVAHQEPILVIGIEPETLENYVDAFVGVDVAADLAAASPERALPDAIAGATVSSAVIRDAIIRAGRSVLASRGHLGGSAAARLDTATYEPAGWSQLLEDGSIVRRRFTRREVAERFREQGIEIPEPQRPDALFIELFAGLATPARAGQNLLGKLDYTTFVAAIGVGDQLVFVGANGLYSFKGTEFVRSGRFERIQLVQGGTTIALTRAQYRNIERLRAAGAPELREAAIFIVPQASGFDPLEPWRLELSVDPETLGGDGLKALLSVDYALPDRYRLAANTGSAAAEDTSTPLWLSYWLERWGSIAFVTVILVALTAVLFVQDWVVRDDRLYRFLRHGLLAVTLLWIGWYASAQLSVVNVLTFVHSLMTEFRWEFFLLDPLIFILWSYVAVTMLFWGRGVFCGWLCPFGALQELLNQGARRLRIPQVSVPFLLHERLWPVKYVLFVGLFAVSLSSTKLAFLGAEVEPFKTAISLKFMREWPFVTYAVALLAVGLVIERFFCRYLCPLGAALAMPARLRMFEWLKRKPQCGRECQICAQRCPVQAIHPIGSINPNECIHCLQCQQLYYDAYTCPPLVAQRKRRERRLALAGGGPPGAAED